MVANGSETNTLELDQIRPVAFRSLRDLLIRLSDRYRLILFIDDVQWGDIDSAQLIASILRPPDQPRVFILLSYRSEEASTSPFLLELLKSADMLQVRRSLIPIEPLSHETSISYVKERLANLDISPEWAESIVARSGGIPFFLNELCEELQLMHDSATSSMTTTCDPSIQAGLHELVWRRYQRLDIALTQALELIAVAARPLEISLMQDYQGSSFSQRTISQLAQSRLTRTIGFDEDVRIVTYHDIIRESIVAKTAPETQVKIHAWLANYLERAEEQSTDLLAHHWLAAGEPLKAGTYLVRAAQSALDSFAFDRSVNLFKQAIELLKPEGKQRLEILESLADAQTRAGYCIDVAETYCLLESCGLQEDTNRNWKYLWKAAHYYYLAGKVAAARQVTKRFAKILGIPFPDTQAKLVFAILLENILLQWDYYLGSRKQPTDKEFRRPSNDRIVQAVSGYAILPRGRVLRCLRSTLGRSVVLSSG